MHENVQEIKHVKKIFFKFEIYIKKLKRMNKGKKFDFEVRPSAVEKTEDYFFLNEFLLLKVLYALRDT